MLKRAKEPMLKFVKDALIEKKLMDAYKSRPPYQRNDYLGWINRAKKEETKGRRLKQMLSELRKGNKYMHMDWGG